MHLEQDFCSWHSQHFRLECSVSGLSRASQDVCVLGQQCLCGGGGASGVPLLGKHWSRALREVWHVLKAQPVLAFIIFM